MYIARKIVIDEDLIRPQKQGLDFRLFVLFFIVL